MSYVEFSRLLFCYREDAFSKKIWEKNSTYIFENIYLPAAQSQKSG